MEELREKAKKSIIMKKPTNGKPEQHSSEENGNYVMKVSNEPIGQKIEDVSNSSNQIDSKWNGKSRKDISEVSENVIQFDDSERHKDVKRKESKRSSSRHRDSKHRDREKEKHSKHRSSRNRDSGRKKDKKKRSDSSKSDSSRERRRRKREHRRRKRSYSSSSSSAGRHRSSKYRRSYRKGKSSSSSSSSYSSEERRKRRDDKRAAGLIADKSAHPYFSTVAKIRRERLANERKERFWDGFQWVSKESLDLASKDPTLGMKSSNPLAGDKNEKIVTGKDLRRVVATNLPLEYGLDQVDLCNYLIEKWKIKGDDITFRSIFLNTEQNSGVIEWMEKEMTDMLIKLDGESLLGHTLRFTKVADENGFIHGGDSENLLQDSALLTAQAAAIVNSRIREMQGKSGAGLNGSSESSEKVNGLLSLFIESASFTTMKPSRMIKISNLFDRYSEMTSKQFEELYEDMEDELSQYGQFKRLKIIRNGEEKLGGKFIIHINFIIAEVGSVFVEFENEDEAILAKNNLKGRVYDGRDIKAIFIPDFL